MAQQTQGGSSRKKYRDSGDLSQFPTDWVSKEATIQKELEEARARTAQMEKTMRWWSDCTANWREKWSKVRNERNKAREEAKQLKTQLDELTKEMNAAKFEKSNLESHVKELKGENDKLLSMGEKNIVSMVQEVELRRQRPDDNHRQRASLDSRRFNIGAPEISTAESVLASKLSELKLKLDDTSRNLKVHKEERVSLLNKIDVLSNELQNAKQDLSRQESHTVTSNESCHSEVDRLQMELQEEVTARQQLEEKYAQLKMDYDRLKSENNIQWSKRELLETENISILRENKKLYRQVCELKEEIHRLNRLSDSNSFCLLREQYKLRRSNENLSNESPELSNYDNKISISGEDDELAIIENDEKESVISS